ncbi:hypothetical protein F5884DRAFT_857961 [Xylogone sp. PMI_703]|nr:hypothetical protein F5884DRAFT_857961 [Xylogone sp. PMI_703]
MDKLGVIIRYTVDTPHPTTIDDCWMVPGKATDTTQTFQAIQVPTSIAEWIRETQILNLGNLTSVYNTTAISTSTTSTATPSASASNTTGTLFIWTTSGATSRASDFLEVKVALLTSEPDVMTAYRDSERESSRRSSIAPSSFYYVGAGAGVIPRSNRRNVGLQIGKPDDVPYGLVEGVNIIPSSYVFLVKTSQGPIRDASNAWEVLWCFPTLPHEGMGVDHINDPSNGDSHWS